MVDTIQPHGLTAFETDRRRRYYVKMPLLRWSNPGHDTRRASSLVRGAGCREIDLHIRRREKNVLDIPFYRSGDYTL
jgi:hypothetical protein